MPLPFVCCTIIRSKVPFAKNSIIHEVEQSVNKMARTLIVNEFKINQGTKFKSLIRGRQVYKNIRNPNKREKLLARLDDQGEALECNEYAIGIYKKKGGDCNELVAHEPTEVFCITSFELVMITMSKLKYMENENVN